MPALTFFTPLGSPSQVLGFVGTSLGSLSTGVIVSSLTARAYPLVVAYRAVFLIYVVVAALKMVLSFLMTAHAEVDPPSIAIAASPPSDPTAVSPSQQTDERQPLLAPTPHTPPAPLPLPLPLPLLKLSLLCLLFSLDSFGSSLIPISFISYYFKLQFAASIEAITRTFGAGALIAGFSQLGAGSLARRIGIIPTMVGTHSALPFAFRPPFDCLGVH